MSSSKALIPVTPAAAPVADQQPEACDAEGKCKRPSAEEEPVAEKSNDVKPKQKRRKKCRIQDILNMPESVDFQAEYLLIEFGNKVISKLISEGFVDTSLYRELARLAKSKGYDLNLRKVASDYICFIPILKVLRDIGLDLSYEDDFLLRLAIKWRRPATVQYLLKAGANPTAMGGQPLMDAYMPSAQSKEPDTYILSILLSATQNLPEIPDKFMNKLIKDKNYAVIEMLLAKSGGHEAAHLSNIFKKLIDASELDYNIIRSFIMHQPKLVEGFRESMKSKSGLYVDPDTFALLLEHGIRLMPSEQMKKHIDPYCQRMLETEIGEQI